MNKDYIIFILHTGCWSWCNNTRTSSKRTSTFSIS